VYEGETVTLDITHTATEGGYIEPPFSHLETDETFAGSASSPSGAIEVDQAWWAVYYHNGGTGEIVRNWIIQNNSSGVLDGDTYQFENVYARWESGSLVNAGIFNVVREPDYWEYDGRVLKNGELLGEVLFDGPVILETNGPSLILRTVADGDLFLHELVPDN
jgi:hypothetical protein